nr:TWiK family of potassium channels protein 7-like [Onthophagus taurus]
MLGSTSSPTTAPAYPGFPRSPYIRRISPPGSPAPTKSCCYELHRGGEVTSPYPHHQQQQQQPSPLPSPNASETFLCCCYTIPSARSSTSILATLGVCFLVLAYTVLGAFTFMALEGGVTPPGTTTQKINNNLMMGKNGGLKEIEGFVGFGIANELRSQTVDRLWSITENLNILYRENWTKLAAEEVLEFQEALFKVLKNTKVFITEDGDFYNNRRANHKWTFTSSFLYSLTLITTIGYGSVAPRTSWGKLVTIIYALIGIPLMLLYLSTTGDVLARTFRKFYGKLCGITSSNLKQPNCQCSGVKVRVPVTLCLIIVLAYICSGAFLFHRLENWSILDGSYFCFTSLGTIGFGDLLPGQNHQNAKLNFKQNLNNSSSHPNNNEDKISLFACSAYILTGMALVAMCFSLVQEEILGILKLIGSSCSISTPSECKLRKIENDEMILT